MRVLSNRRASLPSTVAAATYFPDFLAASPDTRPRSTNAFWAWRMAAVFMDTQWTECLKFVGVRDKHRNRDRQRAEILLKLKILVRRDKDIELVSSSSRSRRGSDSSSRMRIRDQGFASEL